LVQLCGIYDRKCVFLTLDDLRLQRGINFIKADRSRSGREAAKERNPRTSWWNPELQALEIGWCGDLLCGAGDLSEALVPEFVLHDKARLRDQAAQMYTKIAIKCGIDLFNILEREAYAGDRGFRHQC